MITSSDGIQYNSWSDYYLKQPNEAQEPVLSDTKTTSREPVANPQEDEDMYERRKRHMDQDRSEVDRSNSVPLLAASTPNGIAIDHRVNTNMEYEGKVHDLTPFLKVHEDAERDPYYANKEKGMEPKEAYETAHDKVAIPAETSARNAYAIKEGLDPEEFGKAYNNHMQAQMKIAAEPTDVPRHPEAHTNDFEHHYIKTAELAGPTHNPIQMDVLGSALYGAGGLHPGPGRINKPANENKTSTERVLEHGQDPKLQEKAAKSKEFRTMLKDVYDKFQKEHGYDPLQIEQGEPDFSKAPLKKDRAQREGDSLSPSTPKRFFNATGPEGKGELSMDLKYQSTIEQLRDWFNPPK